MFYNLGLFFILFWFDWWSIKIFSSSWVGFAQDGKWQVISLSLCCVFSPLLSWGGGVGSFGGCLASSYVLPTTLGQYRPGHAWLNSLYSLSPLTDFLWAYLVSQLFTRWSFCLPSCLKVTAHVSISVMPMTQTLWFWGSLFWAYQLYIINRFDLK